MVAACLETCCSEKFLSAKSGFTGQKHWDRLDKPATDRQGENVGGGEPE